MYFINYDILKRMLLSEKQLSMRKEELNWVEKVNISFLTFMAGGMAAVIAWMVAYPFDTIKNYL
eukprot:CAMPEP_0170549980 /NCGR_PEP_ID=MMETSP0211-20121228/8050_1 /TAXON_ID=311385 /ORGANISM="Pseudokeronopsis sp., Strain OXSARD2" /LENGTH=63 /DNA_ID=CAMNT_0010856241 /DNA_START=493 /DNA_END=684 /DNA_ORIENTATION=-